VVHFKAWFSTSDYGKVSAELRRIWKEAVKTQSGYYFETGLERRRKISVSTFGAKADIPTGHLPNTRQSVANTAPHLVIVHNYYHVPQDTAARGSAVG
jgi:hypothetical protein